MDNERKPCKNGQCMRSIAGGNGASKDFPCFLNDAEMLVKLMEWRTENPLILKSLLKNCEFKERIEDILGVSAEDL